VDLSFYLFVTSVVLLVVVLCFIKEMKRRFEEVEKLLRDIVEHLREKASEEE
jgi:hypothetical protein